MRIYYSLNPEFLAYYDSMGTPWPKDLSWREWLSKNEPDCSGVRNGASGKLGAGRPVPTHYVLGFIAYSRFANEFAVAQNARETLYEFLKSKGVDDPESLAQHTILQYISTRSDPPKGVLLDIMSRGIEVFEEVFHWTEDPQKHVRPCRDEGEVCEAVQWMYIRLGRYLRPRYTSEGEAERLAADFMQIERHDYEEIAVKWWRKKRATVVMAIDGQLRKGMAIALPLTEEAYEAVRRGERKSYSCTVDDFQFPGPNLLIEAVATAPPKKGTTAVAMGRTVYCAMVSQHAYLTDWAKPGEEFWMRLLTFAVIPKVKKWLRLCGYQSTYACMMGTQIPIFERPLRMHGKGRRDARRKGIWEELQKLSHQVFDETPTPSA